MPAKSPRKALVQRPETRDYETNKLPLAPINWALEITEADLSKESRASWPPTRFRERQNRLALYSRVYTGDHSDFVTDRKLTRVSVNYYRRVINAVTNLLLRVPVEQVGQPLIDDQALRHLIADCLLDQMRYGAALLRTTIDPTGDLRVGVVDPATWYPVEGGGDLVTYEYTSAEAMSAAADRVTMFLTDADGFLVKQDRELQHGQIGDAVSPPEDVGRAWTQVVPHTPRVAGWGTSLIDDLLPLVLELAIQQTRISHVLNAHSEPTLLAIAEQSELDWLAADGEAEGWDDEFATQPEPDADGLKRATETVREIRRQDVALAPSPGYDLKYVEYQGKVDGGMGYIALLREQLGYLSGIPSVLDQSTGAPSGVALKRLLVLLYGDSGEVQEDTRVAVEQSLNAPFESPVVALDWPDALDYFDQDTAQPMA